MAYQVSTPAYSGGFDVLLQLILRQRVEIFDISIAQITDAFVAEIDRMSKCDLEVTTEFLVIAATLLEIKAKRLLPNDTAVDLDDEFDSFSERDLLLSRLMECAMFRDVSAQMKHLAKAASLSRPRRVGVMEERWLNLAPALLEGATPDDLRSAYLKATAIKPTPQVDLTHITPISVTVGDAVAELVTELSQHRRATFRRLTAGIDDRIEMVVRFLAVLELVKQGLADVEQATTFGDIVIVWTGGDDEGVREAAMAGADTYDG